MQMDRAPAASRPHAPVVVLGLGNLLRSDEGLGIHALQRLRARYLLPERVRLVDGGTLGLELLSYLEDADRVLVLDAALADGPPGTLLRVAGADIPAYFGMRTSPHEIALPDLLAVAKLRGRMPPDLVVLGLRPERIALGWELSPAIAGALDSLVAAAVGELKGWGIDAVPASAQARSSAELTAAGVTGQAGA